MSGLVTVDSHFTASETLANLQSAAASCEYDRTPRWATSSPPSPTSMRASLWGGPGAVRMENMLVRWVADLVGYPALAAGHIASGGSIATLAAVVAAAGGTRGGRRGVPRRWSKRTSRRFTPSTMQLPIAGLGQAQQRQVAMDDRFLLAASWCSQ